MGDDHGRYSAEALQNSDTTPVSGTYSKGNVSLGGLGGGAYCVLAGRMWTAKSYLWLIQFKTKLQ